MNDNLVWKEEGRKTVFSCRVFNVGERYCRPPSPAGRGTPDLSAPDTDLKTYMVLDTSDWAMVVPLIESGRGREFVMVRQWRHGAEELSLEFPGGVLEKGENPAEGAARELREETGYTAEKIESLGVFNPNPAIMSNRIHFFLARGLKAPLDQQLDEDEYVEVETVPQEEVLAGLGKAPYIHALIGTAMALYLQKAR